MTAVLVLPGSAPEQDWHAARARGISASRVAALMGLSSWSSPYKLYHQMRGTLPWDEDSDAMALGRYLEAYVCDRFAERHPEFFWMFDDDGRALYAHPDRPWQLATPDRLLIEVAGPTADIIAVLEAKTDNSHDGWGDDGTDEIPVTYRCQVLWQCDVLGTDHWFLACLFLHSRKLRVYEGIIDDQARADLELMRREAQAFLARVEAGDPPDVDWRPPTTSALRALHPSVVDKDMPIGLQLARRYRAAVRNLKAAEERKALYDNKVREAIGDGRRAVCYAPPYAYSGDVVARRDVYDLPEKVITRKASTVNRLVPAKPKEPS